MSQQTPRFYEFGNFRLDLEEKVLLSGENCISVTPKVFETLLALIEEAGRVVGKDELMRKIWSDRFVEESNLTFNIKMLRKALGDNAAEPRFIETVPRRGYRFIAEIKKTMRAEEADFLSSPSGAATSETSVVAPPRRSFLVLAAFGLILLGTLAVGSWLAGSEILSRESKAPVLSAPFRAEKLSNTTKVSHAVISPDGKFVAYTDETNGRYGVWLRRLETSENIQIVPPSDVFYLGLAFAHDGQSIYFVRKPPDDRAPTGVYRISLFGGVPEKIAERAEGWISVSPDDRQISFVRCLYEENDFCSLYLTGANGHGERKLLTRARPDRIGANQFSPDGKSIAFAAGQSSNGGKDFRLMRVETASGAESEITARKFFNIKSLSWLPDGGLLFTAAETLNGKTKIWRAATDGETEALTKDATDYASISLTKNADKIIATQVGNNFRLHFAANGETKILTAARWLTCAPDGKVIYSTDDGNIWAINRGGGEQRQLTNDSFMDFSPRVSPDNQFIFFASNRTGANQVWRMNADGSNQIQITEVEGGYPRFVSPGGEWVYYESGLRQTLWRVRADGSGGEAQISDEKMYEPAFSADGDLVAYFFRENEWKIGVMNLAGKASFKVINYVDGKSSPVRIVWSLTDNRTLHYINRNNGKNTLWQQSLDEDAPRFVADLGDGSIGDFSFAPGGDGFAYIRGEWLHDAVLIGGLK